jgi:hypothetical protein
MPELPTGTVTFLFTDIDGSRKAVQRLGTESYNETKVTRRVQIRVSGMARLMEPLMRLMVPKNSRGFLANLKRVMKEKRPTP